MERRAFGVLGGKTERIKVSNVDPAWLAGELRTAHIIGPEDEERAKNVHVARAHRLEELVGLVQGNGRRDVFQMFVNILLSQKHTDWLGKELKGTRYSCLVCPSPARATTSPRTLHDVACGVEKLHAAASSWYIIHTLVNSH